MTFIFSKEAANHAIHVEDFLKRDTLFVYQLGSKPFVAIPIDRYHYRIRGVLAHANMYSSLARSQLLIDYKEGKMKDNLDTYISNTLPLYMYHTPLCYQLFPMTENRKNWHKNSLPFSKTLSDLFISWTNLENEPEPGFTIMYWFAKIVPFLLFFLIVWMLSYISCLSCSGLKGKRVR